MQGITINWKGKNLNIYNLYHPPNQKSLSEKLFDCSEENNIFLGDLNAKHIHWGSSTNNQRGVELLNMMDDNAHIILNDGSPTHSSYSYNTEDVLDVSFASPDIFPYCIWGVLPNIGSDHLPILVEVKRKHKTVLNRKNYWNFKKANWESYRDLADCYILSEPLTEDLDATWLAFKSIISTVAGQTIPRGNFKRFTPFFLHSSPLLKPLLEKRDKLLQEIKTSNEASLRSNLNKVNAEIKRTFVLLKRKNWNELCKSIDARTPNSRLWKLTKSISTVQPQHEESNSILDENGQIPPDDKATANLVGSFYQRISKLNFTKDDKKIEDRARRIIHGCRSSTQGNPIFRANFTLQEMELALNALDIHKSPGPDNIHGQMISRLGIRGKKRLLEIFNLSWRLGRLPRDWKRALVIPIRKPNKKASSPESYRPIALTNFSCKLMEKMILERLTFHLESRDLLPNEQYGFRRGHSTVDQILYFGQRVRDSQNLNPTNHTVAVFLDLTKAFDRVWRNKLIIKLFDTFGVKDKALSWICDFMKDRLIRVKLNNSLSKTFKLSQGVPQGSVLSPLLFSLFLAGIEKVIAEKCEVGLFADDIVLWNSDSDTSQIESLINLTLTDVMQFANTHKLSFNTSKSVVSFFTTNRHLYNYQPHIIMDGNSLLCEKHPKYLGYSLDPEILSNKHIEHLVDKSRKRLNILKYISGRDWGADADTLRTTYKSLIRPVLEYGFQVYHCASFSNLLKLERVQLSAARIITGMRNSCPAELILYECDLQPLSFRRSAELVKYYNKLYSYDDHNRTSTFLRGWSCNQRLKRNSPFSQMESMGLLDKNVEKHSLKPFVNPLEGLPKVHFQTGLTSYTNKKYDIPEYLHQLALEIINQISHSAIQIFTDGSKVEHNACGSGVFIKAPTFSNQLKFRNPDFCSVFRSELIAIEEGLKTIKTESAFSDVWILTDSRSAIQHLCNWTGVGDRASLSILEILKDLSQQHEVYLQWVPSHIGLFGNETADCLAKAGASLPSTSRDTLTYLETYSRRKILNQHSWKIPPSHAWYDRNSPGGALNVKGDRRMQTTICRFASGHLKCLTFNQGQKIFPICSKCNSMEASPDHLLSCLRLDKEDIFKNPLLVYDYIVTFGLLDLI